MSNPIWKSRRFWVSILDIVITLSLYFVAKYVPGAIDDVKFVMLALQPLALALIIAYTVEDINLIKAEAEKHVALLSLEETKVYQNAKLVAAKCNCTPEPE
jgi:hypothetical protein